MGRLRTGAAIWMLVALVILFFHGQEWQRIARGRGLRAPVTPADLTNPLLGHQWHLLMDARPYVPEGSEFTVESGDLDSEMYLFMLALAVYPNARAVPTSYFGSRFPALGGKVRYVIDEGCRRSGGPDRRIIARLADGCVEIRR